MTKRTGWTIPLGEARLNSDGEFWYHGTDRIVGPQEIKRRGIQPPAKQRPEIRDYRDLLGVSVSKARHNYGRAYFASDFEHSQMFAGTGGPIYRVAAKDFVRYRPRAIKDYESVKYVYTSRSVRPKHLQVTRDQGRTWKPVREAYFPSDDGYWYHGTAAKNVLSIRRKGLLSAFHAGREPNYPREGGPGWKNPEGLLHLTKYADAAHNWHAATGYSRDDGNPGKGVVLRVPSHVVNRLRPSLDRNAVQAFYKPFTMQAANREVDTITVSRPVHPRHVEMLTAKGWRPLRRRKIGESRHTDALSDGLIHSTVHPFTVYKNPTARDWHELASHPLSAPVGYSASNPAPHKAEFRVLIHKHTGDLYAWPAYAMFHHGVRRLLGHGPVSNAFLHDIAVRAHDGTIKPELRFGAFAAWQKSQTKTAETV